MFARKAKQGLKING